MRFLATQFTLSAQALEIYFAGCKGPHCEGCHNPESWNMSGGDYVVPDELYWEIADKVASSGGLVKSIRILGGEPLDQPQAELGLFVDKLNKLGLPVWLFTRYEIYDIPFSLRIKFSYIKTGRYVKAMKTENEYLASSNQKLLRRGYDY